MDRSNAKILFSLLSGVALFLYIAYSVVGTIGSDKSSIKFATNQGVNFHDGILNAPSASASSGYSGYDQSDMSIPEYSPSNKASVANLETTDEPHSSEYANNSGSTSSTNRTSESTESKSNLTTVTLSSKNNHQAAENQMAGTSTSGASSLTTDGSLSNRQSVGSGGSTNGARDPGTKVKQPPIPVGNGLLFLLFLSGIYSLCKSATKIKQLFTRIYFNSPSLKNKNFRA